MTNDYAYPQGCSEQYAELCALSTSGELSAEEWSSLERHVAQCASCASLLQEYNSLVRVGMAKIAPDEVATGFGDLVFSEKRVEVRLVAAMRAEREKQKSESAIHLLPPTHDRKKFYLVAFRTGIAAALILGVAGAYELGRKNALVATPPPSVAAVRQLPIATDAEKARFDADRAALQKQLTAAQAALAQVTTQAAATEKQVADLSSAKTSLVAQIDELTRKEQAASDSLLVADRQRDGLQQQLNEASRSLQLVKDDLSRAQQERQGAVLRVASLETEVNSLHTSLAVTDKSASTNEQFLAQDRDIRELMGARQLYIADVMDVQGNGERSKPFGRVFYTKGKKLIFYAFDLQAQPGYRDAKAFQAWGKPDSSSDKPISLGIFYMDNEKNKRWVLKSDDPATLAQINAIFVTVEPNGGSTKPTGKPFLEAYLHSLPPNHP
ncbi:MAG: hypothetical protein WDN23_05180 [Edaphobacter sp.]